MKLLKEKIAESSQSKVAAALGYSSAAISNLVNGKYGANGDTILQRVRELYGGESVDCPELGEITLGECSGHKKRTPTTDSYYARMYRACQKCERSKP
jgi:hypothetical protein